MNKQLPHHEVFAAFAVQRRRDDINGRAMAARDLLDAAADLLKDSDEGLMAQCLAFLLHAEQPAWAGGDRDQLNFAADRVSDLAFELSKRFEAAAERRAA